MKKPIKKIDLHMHTVISDGTDTLSEILLAVKESKIDLFSVTDHDAIKGGIEMPTLLGPDDPEFIRGVEFSCRDEQGSYHILGYGYDPTESPIVKVIEKGHGLRLQKFKARVDFVREEFGFEFSKEDLEELFDRENPGKPHLANLMVKYGYANDKQDAISNYINKRKFRSEYVSPREAIEGILGSGGIPILAHPSYGNGEDLILGQDMEDRLLRLMDFGIKGLEAYYSGFSQKIQEENLGLAKKYNLYVTCGSDYHGTNKLVKLGDNNLDDIEDGPIGLKRFLEDVRKIN